MLWVHSTAPSWQGHPGHHLTPPCPGAIGQPPRAGQQQLQPGQRALRLAWHRVTVTRQQGREGEHQGGTPSLPSPQHQGQQGAHLTCPPLLSSLEASKKPGCSTGPRHWTEGSGSGKNIPVSPATAARGQQGEGAVLSHPVTPALLPRKNWSSSWTVLEGGILTFFKDSKHSAASALVRGPVALGQGSSYGMEPAPMGLGQHPWDRASTRGTGQGLTGCGQHV